MNDRTCRRRQVSNALLGPYSTFEEYVKDIEGLAITTARDKIASYLVHKAIAENLGTGFHAPDTEAQVVQLYRHETAIAKFKTEKRIVTTKDGDSRWLPRLIPPSHLDIQVAFFVAGGD